MDPWRLTYTGWSPGSEGVRETLCALGNGHIVSRAAAAHASASETHYPGTYLAGGYNRLTSEVAGHEIENEDLVNLPNWLPVSFRIGDGEWLSEATARYLDYRQELDVKAGVLTRILRLEDTEGRITRWHESRLVSMDDPHLAALSLSLTPENWSGPMTVRSAVDGGVVNWGVARYRALADRHLEVLDSVQDGVVTAIRTRMVQNRREVALAARTGVTVAGQAVEVARGDAGSAATVEFDLEAGEGQPVQIEKVAAYRESRDFALSEPLMDAIDHAGRSGDFEALRSRHARAWAHLWEQFDIRVSSRQNHVAQLKLRLHIFHLLQTISPHTVGRDVGVPPRGWHGEAYRGHVMWDELFILPYVTLRMPVLTRSVLRYRYRRLDAARRLAAEQGYKGAMFPWMSGTTGREETQKLHLNPKSGRWLPDTSNRQRHVGAAIAYNVWDYIQATDDRGFLHDYGAELFLEIARFWASIATERPDGRYGIKGVMGPDEFHTAYPGADPAAAGGLDNNAYTNVMAAWILSRAFDLLDLLSDDERRRLCERLDLGNAELERWEEVSRRLFIPFDGDGIVCQFEGYDKLKELDWERLRREYDDLQRIDRILEAEGDDPNNYKVSKQADLLMIFYLFSREEIERIFDQLGYVFTPDMIERNVDYYMARTSHGSTLSWLVHAWVLARGDRQRSWQLTLQALDSDIEDVQGGTTSEGIHLGAMSGTVDLIQRCYTGIEMRSGALTFNPRLPDEVDGLDSTIRYCDQILDVEVTQTHLVVSSRILMAAPVTIAYRGHLRQISPGQSVTYRLVPELRESASEA